MIQFSVGDSAVLNLTATDGNGNPVNLTGATFSTQILGPNGAAIATFGNAKHTIISAVLGTFTLTLLPTDTPLCGVGANKEIVTTITQSGLPVAYHGPNLLTVLPNTPVQ